MDMRWIAPIPLALAVGCAPASVVLKSQSIPAGQAAMIMPHPACGLEVSVIDDDGDGLPDRVEVVPSKECHEDFIMRMKAPRTMPKDGV